MKVTFCIPLFLVTILNQAFGQSEFNVNWVKNIDPNNQFQNTISDITTHKENIYVAGFTEDGMDIELETNPISIEKGFYVLKYSLSGDFVWAKVIPFDDEFGGVFTNRLTKITVSSDDRIYVVGNFGEKAAFDLGLYDAPKLDAFFQGIQVPMLLEMDIDGNFISAKLLISPSGYQPQYGFKKSNTEVTNLFTDNDGSIYISGRFVGEIIAGVNDSNASTLTAHAKSNDFIVDSFAYFIVKLKRDLTLLWAKPITGVDNEEFESWNINVELLNDKIYALTTSGGSIKLDDETIVKSTSDNDFDPDSMTPILAVFNSQNGDLIEYKVLYKKLANRGGEDTFGNDLELDLDGNIYIAGSIGTDGFFDPEGENEFEVSFLTSGFIPFLAKFDNDLKFQWANFIFPTGAVGRELECTDEGNCLMSGEFSSTGISFNESVSIEGSNGSKFYWVEYDKDGNYNYATVSGNNTATGSGFKISDMIISDESEIISIGTYSSQMDFVAFAENPVTIKSRTDTEFYILSFSRKEVVTGIELSDEEFISIYPNPTNSQLYIHSKNLSKIDKITIQDNQGRIIINQKVATDILNGFDVSQLSSGIYFIRILSDKSVFASKFIKE